MMCSAWMQRLGAIACALMCTTVAAAESAAVPAAAAPLDPEAIVAKRGEAVLTVAEVDAKVRSMPPEIRAGYLMDPARMSKLVDSMLLTEQIAIEAEKAGLAESAEFDSDLDLLRVELLSRVGIRHHMDQFKLPDLEQLARETYLASPESYRPKGQIDLRHILIPVEGDGDAAETAAKETAARILDRAKSGEEFGALVEEFMPSKGEVDKSLIVNADISRLDPKFAAALSGLRETGDVVGPVRSRFGWHVVRLERKVVHPIPPYDEVKQDIVDQLRGQAEQAERTRYMSGLSSQPVELTSDVIKALPGRYAGAGSSASAPAIAE